MDTTLGKTVSKYDISDIQIDMSEAAINYQKSLIGHALYKTNNQELSEDLVQTTFFKALLYLQKGGKINTMRIFLNHILHDLIVDEYRKRKTTSLDVLLEKGFDPGFNDMDRIIDIFDGERILFLIDSLPKKYKTILKLKYLRDLSLTEIATLTDQTNNTVAVQLYRGQKKLKVLVAEDKQKHCREKTPTIVV